MTHDEHQEGPRSSRHPRTWRGRGPGSKRSFLHSASSPWAMLPRPAWKISCPATAARRKSRIRRLRVQPKKMSLEDCISRCPTTTRLFSCALPAVKHTSRERNSGSGVRDHAALVAAVKAGRVKTPLIPIGALARIGLQDGRPGRWWRKPCKVYGNVGLSVA